jgi:hypothetical protein
LPAGERCTIILAAARDDQFLVEQDHHEAVAPANALLQNRDLRIPGQIVTISHRVTDFVPEPKTMAANQELTDRTPGFSRGR